MEKIKNLWIFVSIILLAAFSLKGQPISEMPHVFILNIDDLGFPDNTLKAFIYDAGLKPLDEISAENLAIYQNGHRVPINKIEKEKQDEILQINLLVDSRIPVERKASIARQYEQLKEVLPGSIDVIYSETRDFIPKRERGFFRFRQRGTTSETDTLILPPAFPGLDTLVQKYIPDTHQWFVVFLHECHTHAEDLIGFFRQNENPGCTQWFALYFAGETDRCFELSLPGIKNPDSVDNVLFTRIYNDSTFHEQFFKTIGSYHNNTSWNVHYNSGPVKSLKTAYTYRLDYISSFGLSSALTVHTFSKDAINREFISHTLNLADSLIQTQHFDQAHAVLYDAYSQIQDAVLRNTARELVVAELKHLRSKSVYDPFPLFETAEKQWNFQPERESWYRNEKAELLKDFYEKTGQFDEENKLSLLESIYTLDDDDRYFRTLYYHTLGNHYLANNSSENATNAFLEIYDPASAGTSLKQDLLKALEALFPEKYAAKDFATIYQTGLKTHELFRRIFRMNYYFGYSSREMQDFSRAYDLYLFLMNNWTGNQRLITWEELLSSIEQLSIQTRNFNRALEMNIRIQRNEGGREQIEKYLLNMRIQDYYSLSKLLAAFYTRNGISQNLNDIDKNYPGIIAPGIHAIYIIDPQSSVLHTAYKRGNIHPPDITHIGSQQELILIQHGQPDMQAHMIQQIGEGRYLVLELSNAKTDANSIAMRDIDHKHMLNDPWDSLRLYERKANLKRAAIIFSHAIQAELHKRGVVALAAYHRAGAGTDVAYLVHHRANGEVIQAENFDRSKATYAPGDWEKSAATPAYYEQNIQYNNKKIMDIALPLYKNNVFTGVVRIGFKE